MALKTPSFLRTDRSASRRRVAARPVRRGALHCEPLEGRQLLAVNLVSPGGTGGTPPIGGALEPSVSADGNFVAFSSDLSHAGTDTNAFRDVYLHDRAAGTTVLVSRTTGGVAGNGTSSEPSISQDGNFVSFSSVATDIAGGQGSGNVDKDIFIWNRVTGEVTQVSVTTTGGTPGQFSAEPNTNGNGNFVAYTSPASAATLVNGALEGNSLRDVFLWNRSTNTTQLVSTTMAGTSAPGTSGNRGSFDPAVSADGRFVAFRSEADDLVPGADGNAGVRDIYVRDMQTGETILVSRVPGGPASDGESDSPSISNDGNVVVFSSMATNLSPDDTGPAQRDIFVFNRTTNTITLVSRNVARNGSGNGESSEPSISQDGRFVAFTSAADNLVDGDTNGVSDIFLYDISTGAMNRVSLTNDGQQSNGRSSDANVAPQGLFVAFTSEASNLTANDANGAVPDAFVAQAPDRQTGNTNPPTAAAVQADQPPAALGSPFLDLTVTYSDDVDLATTTFDSNDVTITAPGGTPQPATLLSSAGSGRLARVTYRIPAPGGVLDEADNGAYTVTVNADEVKDANGNSVAAGALAPLTVLVTAADGPDLVPSFPLTVPAAVGGSRAKVRVIVTNNGTQPPPRGARMTLSLFLSADGTVDSQDVLVGQVTKKFNAKPTRSKRYTIKGTFNTPAGGPNYQLLAVADSTNTIAESREFNNTAATPVTVAPAFVDLATNVGAPRRPTAVAGRPFVLPVTIVNNGNVPAKGTATYVVVASTDDVLGNADDVLVTATPITRRLSVTNGKTKRVPLRFAAPTLAGSYRFFVTTTFTGITLADTNAANDTDVTDAPVTVA